MSNLYVYKGGKLVPRDPQKAAQHKPTVIHYNHIIRQLSDVQCNCKQQMQRLKKQFQSQILEKDCEISSLINRIAQKETEIERLESEIDSLRNFQNTPSAKQEKNYRSDEGRWDGMDKSLNSTVVSCFSVCDFGSNNSIHKFRGQEIKKTETQMDECFKKTSSLMSQIDGIMKKKRNYEFHNSILVEDSIIEELQMAEERSQQESEEMQMQDTFCLQRSEYNDFDSLDMTTFESVQNYGDNQNEDPSYSKLLRDSILLKNTILEMKEESEEQLKEVQSYYQKQLRISYEELEKQRQRNSLLEITMNKLDGLSQRGRLALSELDQNQSFSVGFSEKNDFSMFELNQQQSQNLRR